MSSTLECNHTCFSFIWKKLIGFARSSVCAISKTCFLPYLLVPIFYPQCYPSIPSLLLPTFYCIIPANLWHLRIYICDAHLDLVFFSSYSSLLDVDECIEGTHDCDNATEYCLNRKGSFNCECTDGYRKKASSCQGKLSMVYIW